MEKRQFAQALALAKPCSCRHPRTATVLYLVAVNQRYLNRSYGRAGDPSRISRQFIPTMAGCSRSVGTVAGAFGDSAAAITAYAQAVNLNAALPASWKALAALYRAAGRTADAQNAANVVATL